MGKNDVKAMSRHKKSSRKNKRRTLMATCSYCRHRQPLLGKALRCERCLHLDTNPVTDLPAGPAQKGLMTQTRKNKKKTKLNRRVRDKALKEERKKREVQALRRNEAVEARRNRGYGIILKASGQTKVPGSHRC